MQVNDALSQNIQDLALVGSYLEDLLIQEKQLKQQIDDLATEIRDVNFRISEISGSETRIHFDSLTTTLFLNIAAQEKTEIFHDNLLLAARKKSKQEFARISDQDHRTLKFYLETMNRLNKQYAS